VGNVSRITSGQALAYKVGELKTQELRQQAQRQLRSAFDIRSFHDQVAAARVMPLDALEQRGNDWVKKIEQQQALRSGPESRRAY
jgi:uncharacterized protein (DUF885 family)